MYLICTLITIDKSCSNVQAGDSEFVSDEEGEMTSTDYEEEEHSDDVVLSGIETESESDTDEDANVPRQR